MTSSSSSPPLVSVGVFAHNQGRYLHECLDSIVASSHRNLQLVIVNDGSEDDTDAIARDWLDAHRDRDATYVRHARARGIGASLNEAIALSRGEFLTGVAADDLLLSDGIRARLEYLLGHPDKLGVIADAHVIGSAGESLFESAIEEHYARFGLRKRDLVRDEWLPFALVFHFAGPGPVFMCRRSAFDAVGLYDETVVTEDFDMFLRLAAIRRLGFYDGYVGAYRVHGRSMTDRCPERLIADAAAVARRRARDFKGTLALRLRAQHAIWQSRQSMPLTRRWAYWTFGRAAQAAARVGYEYKRWTDERVHSR
jgi:glycosyltransferase involved in cell wall biosynthesis